MKGHGREPSSARITSRSDSPRSCRSCRLGAERAGWLSAGWASFGGDGAGGSGGETDWAAGQGTREEGLGQGIHLGSGSTLAVVQQSRCLPAAKPVRRRLRQAWSLERSRQWPADRRFRGSGSGLSSDWVTYRSTEAGQGLRHFVLAGIHPVEARIHPVEADVDPVKAGIDAVEAGIDAVEAGIDAVEAGIVLSA